MAKGTLVMGFRIWNDGMLEPEWVHNDCASLQEQIVGANVGGTVKPLINAKMKTRQPLCRFCHTG